MIGMAVAILLIIMCVGLSYDSITLSEEQIAVPTPTSESVFHKKMIEYRGTAVTAAYLKGHMSESSNRPLNGTTYVIDSNYVYAFDARRQATWNDLNPASFSNISWGHYTDNFVLVFTSTQGYTTTPGFVNMDWYSDSQWNNITSNIGLIARAAKVSGAKGLMLDTEAYSQNPWKYDSTSYGGKSFQEVQSMVRQRGAQWMTAIQKEYPNVTIYSCWLSSLLIDKPGGDASKLSSSPYGLLPAFENGMLDVLSPNATIIDGNELSYYYSDTNMFYNASNSTKNPPSGFIAPEDMAKYMQQVKYGAAVYVDGTIYNNDYTADYRSEWWQHQIYNSLATSDEYVFFFHGVNTYSTGPDWANMAGPALDGFMSATNKFYKGIPLGYDLGYINDASPSKIMTSPTINITQNGNNRRFYAPANVTVTAVASGGNISRIEFYLNSEKNEEVFGDSGNYTWNNLPPGSYEVIARVYDTKGNHGTSGPIRITVQ